MKMDLRGREERALVRHGLAGIDRCLMGTAGYRIALPPAAFVACTRNLSQGGLHGDATPDDLTIALDRLLSRRLLTVLTATDIAAESARIERSTVPELVAVETVTLGPKVSPWPAR